MLDFIRIACAVPAVKVADVKTNTRSICEMIAQADEKNVDVLVFPELALTGYTCGDLLFQDSLHNAVEAGLQEVLDCSAQHPQLSAVVGLPVRTGMHLYNCAAVISGGELQALTYKTYLPDYGAFSENRWFSQDGQDVEVTLCGQTYLLDGLTLINVGGSLVGVEICEDLFSPVAPSAGLAMSGAEVIVNLAASAEIAGGRKLRTDWIKAHSAACKCVYAFCSAGYTESTSDLVYSGHSMIAENGVILQENTRLCDSGYMLVQDCDLGKIRAERRINTTFRAASAAYTDGGYVEVTASAKPLRSDGTLYPLQKLPFIPSNKEERIAYCRDVFDIQVAGLMRRMEVINAKAVIGISGGLDSTLALLVAVEATRRLGRPLTDVHGITMPCFGTSDRTYNNAWEMMRKLGISCEEISIKEAVMQHFADIGHDPSVHNTTYENAQARERTQILMDYAGRVGGIVVGTGDLSELALGWCTYNGDHMSMYSVNGSVPKTLIRWIVEAVADTESFAVAKNVWMDVLDTPISPELLPPDAEGKISQQTEDIVGPYALHDFFLYYVVRYGFTPTKIYALACRAFRDDFDAATVKKWLVNFYRRFFTQQFKRNCQPDGAKACLVGLGPRGDWKMPSDAAMRIWQEEAENL